MATPPENVDTTKVEPDLLKSPTEATNGASPDFTWLKDYHYKMEKTAADSLVGDWDWSVMRDAVKTRIHQIVTAYLMNQHPRPKREVEAALLDRDATLVDLGRLEQPSPSSPTITISPSMIEQRPSTLHGLILPAFPKRESEAKMMPWRYSVEEANEEMEQVFSMLDEFEDHPPFTIQRVCELLVTPQIYKSVGKFMRALQRALLVTSTADQYATDTYAVSTGPAIPGTQNNFADASLKLAMTPLFSPIPFLHPDLDPVTGQPLPGSRRPFVEEAPSPMMLNDDIPPSPRLGLVDELDDPTADSNHLADHPQAISATTTVRAPPTSRVVDVDDMDMDEADLFGATMDLPTAGLVAPFTAIAIPSGNLGASFSVGSLNDRFVRSSTPEPEAGRALFERDRQTRTTNGSSSKSPEGEENAKMDTEEPQEVKAEGP